MDRGGLARAEDSLLWLIQPTPEGGATTLVPVPSVGYSDTRPGARADMYVPDRPGRDMLLSQPPV